MHHFAYRDGVLCAESVNLETLAEEIGTPFYCYSTATLERHFRLFDEALQGLDHLVCYAMKAASNQAILRTLARLGRAPDETIFVDDFAHNVAGAQAVGMHAIHYTPQTDVAAALASYGIASMERG